MSLTRLAYVSLVNLKMLVRNRTALFFSLLFPLIFMVIFGLIFGTGGQPRSDLNVVGSGPLVTALERSGAVRLHPRPDAEGAIQRVRDGKEEGALVLSGGSASLYVSNVSPVEAAALREIVRGAADAVNLRASGRPPVVTVETRSVESSSLKYIDFLVPGLLAMALSQSAVLGVAATLVSFRERGIFRRLRVTPLPLAEFALGQVVSHLALAVGQAVVLLAVGRLLFGVHLAASLGALLALVLLGALCFVAIGFLVGSVSRTQDAAAAIGNVITLPMVFLAGVFFSLDTAPGWLQQTARALPLTYLADGLRDVAVRGHSLASILSDLGVLGGVALAVTLVSLRFFRWEPAA